MIHSRSLVPNRTLLVHLLNTNMSNYVETDPRALACEHTLVHRYYRLRARA